MNTMQCAFYAYFMSRVSRCPFIAHKSLSLLMTFCSSAQIQFRVFCYIRSMQKGYNERFELVTAVCM